MNSKKVEVIDLFCGIGGMTHGFVLEGFNVKAGIDIDETCKFGYTKNNKSQFINKDINEVTKEDLDTIYSKDSVKVLIGCAPCQPFSKLNVKKGSYTKAELDKKWSPLKKFAQLIEEVQPDIVSMENVKDLADIEKYPVFKHFLDVLERNSYSVSYKVVDCTRYGVPQKRKRIVLLASKHGEIKLIPETHDKEHIVTVREIISTLPEIEDGEVYEGDLLHRARKLSEMNKKRIHATPKDGGDASNWNDELLLECHKKDSGKTFLKSVYGRMKWDEPAPTMTTQCIGLGNGRYGHPEQDRAISLREAALFQTFPGYYEFTSENKNYVVGTVAKQIGNAVPVRLGQVIAQSIRKHLATFDVN